MEENKPKKRKKAAAEPEAEPVADDSPAVEEPATPRAVGAVRIFAPDGSELATGKDASEAVYMRRIGNECLIGVCSVAGGEFEPVGDGVTVRRDSAENTINLPKFIRHRLRLGGDLKKLNEAAGLADRLIELIDSLETCDGLGLLQWQVAVFDKLIMQIETSLQI